MLTGGNAFESLFDLDVLCESDYFYNQLDYNAKTTNWENTIEDIHLSDDNLLTCFEEEKTVGNKRKLKAEPREEQPLIPHVTPKKARTTVSSRSWRHEEYVLLAGITMTYFGRCHSMKEARKTVDYGSKSITTAWFNIQLLYEVARKRMNEMYGLNLGSRSPNALRKKWKDSGSKVENYMTLEDESQTPDTILKLIEFNTEYNRECILTCSVARYNKLKPTLVKDMC